jgi:hypothetical protein
MESSEPIENQQNTSTSKNPEEISKDITLPDKTESKGPTDEYFDLQSL